MLGDFHQAFLHVAVPGLQPAHEQQIDEQVEVVRDGLAVHGQRRRVEQ
jgi:hypothetical protein